MREWSTKNEWRTPTLTELSRPEKHRLSPASKPGHPIVHQRQSRVWRLRSTLILIKANAMRSLVHVAKPIRSHREQNSCNTGKLNKSSGALRLAGHRTLLEIPGKYVSSRRPNLHKPPFRYEFTRYVPPRVICRAHLSTLCGNMKVSGGGGHYENEAHMSVQAGIMPRPSLHFICSDGTGFLLDVRDQSTVPISSPTPWSPNPTFGAAHRCHRYKHRTISTLL